MSEVFEPVKIGSLALSNRLVMAPVKTAFGAPDGTTTDRLIDYYRRRAEGGVGAIIVEPLFIDPAGKEHPRQLGVDGDDKVEGLGRLVDAIHRGGSLAIAHLNHAGRAANPKASGRPPEAPSEMTCPATGARAVAISVARIEEIVASFGAAARRAREAGFDAVELQCGLGYLIAQFLSSRTNRRMDGYGGGSESRQRFAREVISAVKGALGELPLIARLSASEQAEGGLTPADGVRLARWLEEQGVAALHVASGSACDSPPWYYQHMSLPHGANAAMARKIRQGARVPVIAAGRLGDPDELVRLLADDSVDLVALGRPLVADPDLPRKLHDGHPERVLQCGGCLQGCLTGVKSGKGIGCIVNPELGVEGEAPAPVTPPRRVVVVGGGPAGLTAASIAAERGHRVTLLERGEELGGQFALSHLAPGKQAMSRTVASLVRLAEQSGAELRRGVEATAEGIAALDPDVVLLATGATPIVPEIPGLGAPLTGEDILSGTAEAGATVLVIGGGLVGIEVAEYLAKRGTEVVVVEMLAEIARDMEPITRKLSLKRLAALPVTVLAETRVSRLGPDGTATVASAGGPRDLGPFDTVVAAVGTRRRDELSAQLTERHLEVHVVGDAAELAQVQGAVRSAWEVARGL